MVRSALITFSLAVGLGSFAQAQVVNSGGYATTSPNTPVVGVVENPLVVNSAGAPSIPAIGTPFAHVGPEAAPVRQAGIQTPTAVIVEPAPEANQGQAANSGTTQTFNFGAANFSTNPYASGETGTSQESLAEAARQARQKGQNVNAKLYTNADIERLNQATGVNHGVATNAANTYPANNGVITPPANNQNQNSIAVPMQNQSTTGTVPPTPGPRNSPVRQRMEQLPSTPTAQQPLPPQANAKPSANGSATANTGAGSAENQSNANSAELPKTASRLPLIGVLGFFSISMGLFVRHQRAKSSK